MSKQLLVGFAILVIGSFLIYPKITKHTQNDQSTVQPTTKPTQTTQAPLPQEEDVIRIFFNLIGEKRIPEAVNMMDKEAISDDSQKQAWGVQFNAFKKISLKKIEGKGNNMFKVTLDVEMKPESANGPIPFYGYENGENIRWVEVVKEGGIWKISGIATGP